MKKLLYLNAAVLLLLSGCGNPAESESGSSHSAVTDSFGRGDCRLEISYSTEPELFGNSFRIELRILYPEGESYTLLPPDTGGDQRYSNTVITAAEENSAVYDGEGRAEALICFDVEPWLPGPVLFPPLAVSFSGGHTLLTTDEIELISLSAFSEDTGSAGRESGLAPLYLSEPEPKGPAAVFIIAAAVIIAAAAAGAAVVLKRRKKRMLEPGQPLSRLQLLADFRRRYIDTEPPVDLRAAFTELEPLLDGETAAGHRELIEQARFSRRGLDQGSGYRLLVQIFGLLNTAEENEDEL